MLSELVGENVTQFLLHAFPQNLRQFPSKFHPYWPYEVHLLYFRVCYPNQVGRIVKSNRMLDLNAQSGLPLCQKHKMIMTNHESSPAHNNDKSFQSPFLFRSEERRVGKECRCWIA